MAGRLQMRQRRNSREEKAGGKEEAWMVLRKETAKIRQRWRIKRQAKGKQGGGRKKVRKTAQGERERGKDRAAGMGRVGTTAEEKDCI